MTDKEMECNVERVCSECTRKCQFLHGKGKSSSLLHTSFFKFMFNEDFDKFLYIPPKFCRTMPAGDLLNKTIILQDPSGEQWKVTVSLVDGSFAFKEGWSAFSFDHRLKIGDLLIFNYTSESHFDVLIYDDSACNMLDFSKRRNPKKRSRDRNESSVKDGLLVKQGLKASVVSISNLPKTTRQHKEADLGRTQCNMEKISNCDNISARGRSVCMENSGEDPCYMPRRGLGETERDAKASKFDVLDCEILNNCYVNGAGKVATVDSNVSDVHYGSHACQNEAIICNKDLSSERILETEQMVISRKTHGSQNGSFYNTNQIFNGIPNISDTIKNGQMSKEITKEHVDMTPSVYKYNDELPATGKLRRGAASDPFKLTGRNHSLGPKDKNAHVNKCNTTLEENRENVSIMSNRKVGEYQFSEGLGHISKSIKKEIVEKMTPNMYKDEFPTTGEASEKFKSKLQDKAPFVYKDDLLLATGSSKVIKREPDQSLQPFNEDNESHSQTAATVSCVVRTDNDTFLELPAPLPLSNKRGIKMKRLVVYLRDRLVNLWPVFYHEHSNFYALTEGWSEYRKANNIQPGDLCIFGAENKSNRVMAVNIVHKWS